LRRDVLFFLVEVAFDPAGMKLNGTAEDCLVFGAGGAVVNANGAFGPGVVRLEGCFLSTAV